ncbi:MAG: transglutaminase domain-containing protein [Oscillospiraceae bacterium]|jgi:hypothetical protein
MKGRFFVIGLAALLLLQGCSATFLNREYVTEQAHEENGLLADTSILRADGYESLVDAILQLVGRGGEHGVIRLYNYSGDVGACLSKACLEVKRNRPLGAYAVDYMTYDFSRIVSYYEVNLYFVYRKSYEEIKGVVAATGGSAMKEVLQGALREFSSSAVLHIGYFEEDEAAIRAIVKKAYDATPEAAFGLPDCEISLYPEEGTDRIVEIALTYQSHRDVLLRRQEQVKRAAELLADTAGGDSQKETVTQLYRKLKQRAAYSPTGGDTVYGALVQRSANSEGTAMAMSLLCETAGIPCELVRGTRGGVSWVWNRVTLDGEPVEFDPAAQMQQGAQTPMYRPRGEMGSGYGYETAE